MTGTLTGARTGCSGNYRRSVQLTDPRHYEGCDLQFHGMREIETALRERGAVIVFPSFIQHRVTPCTKGTRKAIVVWTTGPQFK